MAEQAQFEVPEAMQEVGAVRAVLLHLRHTSDWCEGDLPFVNLLH